MDALEQAIERLFAGEERLPAEARQAILVHGDAAVPRLLELAGDDALLETDARGGGMAPVHALTLLGELRAAAAIPRMLEIVRVGDLDDYAFNAAAVALAKMGPAALEPCLAAYASAADPEHRSILSGTLAELGARDERVWEILLDELEVEPVMAASSLAEYGDARAVPLLSEILDEGELEDWELTDFARSIETLGGELSPAQRRRIAAASEAERRRYEARRPVAAPVQRAPRPGRNEPCHCGSGKKYKKCHLESDERGGDAEPVAAQTRSFSRAAFDEVFRALMDEAVGEGPDARNAFFDGAEPVLSEWSEPLCMGYLFWGHRDGDGRRLIDRFATRRAPGLGRQQRAVVDAMVTSWASLFEVVEVKGGQGVRLRDLVGGHTIDVRDLSASTTCMEDDTLFCWIFDVDGHHELLGDMCMVPSEVRETALAAARSGASGRDRGTSTGAVWQVLKRSVDTRRAENEPAADDSEGDWASIRYDSARAPDARDWLGAEEDERIAAVETFHRGLETHPPTPNPRMHAVMHVVVENQVAEGGPSPTRAAIDRLRKAGLTRHEAVHAVGAVVADGIWAVLRRGKGFDSEALTRALAKLRPGDHAGSAPR